MIVGNSYRFVHMRYVFFFSLHCVSCNALEKRIVRKTNFDAKNELSVTHANESSRVI